MHCLAREGAVKGIARKVPNMSSEYMQLVERKRKHLRLNSSVSGNAEHMLELILRNH